MKSYVLVTGDFTTHGGMDCANYHLARWLCEQPRTHVHLVSFNVASALADHPKVTWHRVDKLLNSYTLSEGRLDRAGQRVARSFPGSRVVVNGGNCHWGDVNWVHYVHAAWDAQAGGSIALKLRRAIQHRKHLSGERRAIRTARVVIANSHRTRRDLIDRVGIASDRVKTIYYGIDSERFRPASQQERQAIRRDLPIDPAAPLVAFIGALGDRRKGFDLLFDAWTMLVRRELWNAQLLVMGHGAELDRWKDRAGAAGLSPHIRFLGFRKDVPQLLRACDCLVSPTRYEAYGLGVHEALCCGIPAIVSSGAGVAERYPNSLRALLLPEPLSAETLAEHLYDWHQRKCEYAELARDFSASLRATTWDDMARQIVELMDSTQPTPPVSDADKPVMTPDRL